MGTPLKNQNFENRVSLCFKLAKIKPRAKMSGSWDIFFLFTAQSPKKKKKCLQKSYFCLKRVQKNFDPKLLFFYFIFFVKGSGPKKNKNVPGSWHFGTMLNFGQLKTWRNPIFKILIFKGGLPIWSSVKKMFFSRFFPKISAISTYRTMTFWQSEYFRN